ncbi:small basic family protein [Thermincola ferriacetica]
MWALISILGLIGGLIIGQFFTFTIPPAYATYLSIGILASLDSTLGGIRGVLEDKFDGVILISGFFINGLASAALVFFGDYIGVNLYYVAIFVFGIRIFQNLAITRRLIIARLKSQKRQRSKPFSKEV